VGIAWTEQHQINLRQLLAQPGIFNLNNAASPIEVFQFESKRSNSLYGIAKLGYKDFYIP
jgi:hypothetical protein